MEITDKFNEYIKDKFNEDFADIKNIDDLEKTIRNKKIKAKIEKEYVKYKSLILSIDNYEAYHSLFYNRVPICYASHPKTWCEYHTSNSVEFVFLSFNEKIPTQYRFITFCFYDLEIDENKEKVKGKILVHNFIHEVYRYSFTCIKGKYADIYVHLNHGRESFELYDFLKNNIKYETCNVLSDCINKAYNLIKT